MAYGGANRHSEGTVSAFAGTHVGPVHGRTVENASAPREAVTDRDCPSARIGSRRRHISRHSRHHRLRKRAVETTACGKHGKPRSCVRPTDIVSTTQG